MSKPSVVLGVGKSQAFPVNGRYLYVDSATGVFVVNVKLSDGTSSSYELTRREQLRFDADMMEVNFRNQHSAENIIVFQVGYAQFIPNDDGQKVTLTGQDVSIDTTSADIGGTGDAVATSDTGNFSMLALLKRLLAKFPTSIGQKVKTNSLSVVLSSDHDAVPVSGALTDAELRANPLDVVEPVAANFTPGVVITGTGTIPANPSRRRLIIKALSANVGIGWTHSAAGAGDAIEKGDRVYYETADAVTITGTDPADKFAWCEEE
jgi:hypothetical protein